MPTKTIKRAYKFRCHPNEEQVQLLAQTFGCVRVVWNQMLRWRTDKWREEQESVSFTDVSRRLTELKQEDEFSWLNDVSSVALQQVTRNQQKALSNFFGKRASYPRFKSRKSKQSFTLVGTSFAVKEDGLYIAKSREPLYVLWSREIPSFDPSSLTITKDKAGRYFVSMLFEEQVTTLKKSKSKVGIDLGLTHFAVTSDGKKIPNPRHYRENQAKVTRAQQDYSRKEKGSKNQEKARVKLARAHARVTDQRRDFLHKLSTSLIRENQTIVIEDLAVKNMSARGGAHKRGLNRSILDAGWSEFRRMLEYKADWYGRELIVIDRWFPSSQMCSACGVIDGRKSLDVRTWTCKSCGVKHDRDINAARNILTVGTAVSVCGDGRSRAKTSV